MLKLNNARIFVAHLIAEDTLFFGSGRCASDHHSTIATADFFGLQLCTVQTFLALSSRFFDAGRK